MVLVWVLYNNHCLYIIQNISMYVVQLVEHGASNAKIMGSIPRESKSW